MMSPASNYCFKVLIEAILMVWLLIMLQVDHLFVSAQKGGCILKERHALLQFKAGVVYGYDGILSSWDDHTDCCRWMGVGCKNHTGHIQSLSLHYISIGKISSSLSELQQLRHLELSGNYLEDTHFPEFLGSLTNLRYLDLSFCGFSGKIPTHFGSLPHLIYLNLAGNELEGSIPHQLGNLSKLQYLDLRFNSLEGVIPPQLGNLSRLHQLLLGENYYGALKIDINGHDHGGKWLSNLTSLSHLDLGTVLNINTSHNWLQMISNLSKLKELKLSHCSLSDHFIISLSPSKFSFPTSLSVFDLSLNSFTSPIIFQWVSNVTSNLVELNLGGNLLEDFTSKEFGIAMNSLERLDLSRNRLKGGDLKSFTNICTLHSLKVDGNNLIEDLPSILHNLSIGCAKHSLQDLDLSYNQITDTLSDLSIFSSLKTLDLSTNRLSGKISENTSLPSQLESLSISSNSLEGGIPKSFGNACNLSSLDMSNNSLSEELRVIIHHLSGCARYSLLELNLDTNNINGTIPDLSIFSSLKGLALFENKLNGKIPKNIGFPSQLEYLYLNSNSLEGVITESHFANMSELQTLFLSDNKVALVFSQNWTPPFQLRSIRVRSCQLGPAFPKWLQTQNELTNLDISNAGISDIVPEWFWAKLLPKFGNVDISYNNLKGSIAIFPPPTYSGYSLWAASNQFEGPIPPFLRGVESLDLSKNKFSDALSFVCANGTVETLQQLDLSNNELSGEIPNCWSNFKSLVYLDLSHNNFSEKIPASVGSLLELQALLLRNNSLSEDIPSSMKSCTQLIMLDVGQNNLSGHIPSWIGSRLQELEILILERNRFFGSLPLQLCYLRSIKLLDLSLNNLSGQIPNCIKNFTSMAQKLSTNESSDHFEIIISSRYYMGKYFLNAFLMWKGAEQMFQKNVLFLLRSIDFSSNRLSGEIPVEIRDLVGLVSLNLSRNNLTGQIPSNIGRLTSLEFLDLSRNQLFGSIPSTLSQIDRLAMLDVSHNHLSGRIPTGTQLQGFNALSYEDNLDLCGRPLDKLCITEGEPPQEPTIEFDEDEHLAFAHAFYMSMGFGFAVGFWGIFGSILAKRSWRHAYFRFLNNLTDNIYVMIVVKVAKYKRRLKG